MAHVPEPVPRAPAAGLSLLILWLWSGSFSATGRVTLLSWAPFNHTWHRCSWALPTGRAQSPQTPPELKPSLGGCGSGKWLRKLPLRVAEQVMGGAGLPLTCETRRGRSPLAVIPAGVALRQRSLLKRRKQGLSGLGSSQSN